MHSKLLISVDLGRCPAGYAIGKKYKADLVRHWFGILYREGMINNLC